MKRALVAAVLVGGAAVAATSGVLFGGTGLRSGAISWEAVRPGLELGSMSISAPGEGQWTRAVLLRLDPTQYRLRLQSRLRPDLRGGAWTVDSAPPEAVAAWDAGQFSGIVPWGWTVADGVELRPPGTGPLSMAVVSDTAGRVTFVPPDSIQAVRARGGVATAIQSYPTLLTADGELPEPLRTAGQGVDVHHRDARVALCQLNDNRLLLLLTRFDGLGEAGSSIPLGLTLAETAQLLQSVGCRAAVALDGGISSQLLVRGMDGRTTTWPGWRKVPLGIIVLPASTD